jgi:hypothetical protein
MALFQAAHPVLGSKLAITAGKIFKASVKAGLKLDLDVNNDGVNDGEVGFDPMAALPLAKFNLSNKGKLLVFDDLERCLLKPEEVLGYINAFVEGKEAKVIIIGDETQIGTTCSQQKASDKTSDGNSTVKANAPSSQYLMIKEKVVGKTFYLAETISDIFDALVSSTAYPQTYKIIMRNKHAIIRMFRGVHEATEKHNYRALKHCLRDFEFFYSYIDEQFLENDSFTDDLLCAFATIGYEFQLGNFTFTTGDESVKKYAQMISRGRKNTTPPAERNTGHKFDDILSRHGLQSKSVFGENLWAIIFSNKLVEKEVVSNLLEGSHYFPKKEKEWQTLWRWWQLSDAQAAEALAAVRSKLKKFEYRSEDDILHVFGIFLHQADLKAIPESKEDVLQNAETYLTSLDDQNLIERRVQFPGNDYGRTGYFGAPARDHGGWEYAGSELPEFKKLDKLVASFFYKSYEDSIKESRPSILQDIERGSAAFSQKLTSTFPLMPFLHMLPVHDFVDSFFKAPNLSKRIFSDELGARVSRSDDSLVAEKDWWRDLLEELTRRGVGEESGLITPTVMGMRYLKDVAGRVVSLTNDEVSVAE